MAGRRTIPIPLKKGKVSTGSRLKNFMTLSFGVSSAILRAPFFKSNFIVYLA
jgi:hypothetical protein